MIAHDLLGDGMSISTILRDLRARYQHGEFLLTADTRLRDVVRNAAIPHKFGVYVVHAIRGPKREMVYVGKAGTILWNGESAAQTIPERLTNRQDGMSRERFFADKMTQEHIDHLHFEWFVTFWPDGGPLVPPFLIEAQVLAAYFGKHGRLPMWNKSA